MERLTKRINDVVTYIGTENEYDTGMIAAETASSVAAVREILLRLAAYEDTGREPEEVTALGKIFDYALKESKTLTEQLALLNHIRELAEADKDGRCVMLPCKVGDKLYRVFAGEIFEHRVGSMKYFAIQKRWDIEIYPFCPCVESSIGKTIFLTREEAERAMEEKRNG